MVQLLFYFKGLLLSCSSSPNMEICAMATVKLHTILQTSNRFVVEVECYLLRAANSILQKALKGKKHFIFCAKNIYINDYVNTYYDLF